MRAEDILVVFRTDFDYRKLADQIRARCPKLTKFIKPYGSPRNADKDRYIFEEHAFTLGTVESVKGYDAPIVFLVGADFSYSLEVNSRCSVQIVDLSTRGGGRLRSSVVS